MHIRNIVLCCLLCISFSSLHSQSTANRPIFEPGRFHYGGQLGAAWFAPSGFLQLENRVSDSVNQLFERVSIKHGTGIKAGGVFGLRVNRYFSFLQELSLFRTHSSSAFNYGSFNQDIEEENFWGKGKIDVVSNYMQSFSAIQYSTQGQVALGLQLGIEVNGRLFDQVTGIAEPGNVPASYVNDWEDFPEVVQEALAVPFFYGLGAGFFVRFRMENQEFRLAFRRNLCELNGLLGLQGGETYPRTSSLCLSWLIHQPKSAQ